MYAFLQKPLLLSGVVAVLSFPTLACAQTTDPTPASPAPGQAAASRPTPAPQAAMPAASAATAEKQPQHAQPQAPATAAVDESAPPPVTPAPAEPAIPPTTAKTPATATAASPAPQPALSGYAIEQARLNSDHPVHLAKSRYKPGTGLHFESEDKDFSLATRLRGQLRYTANSRDDWSQKLQFRRARLQFKGNLFGKDNKFKVEFAVSPRDMSMDEDGPGTSPLLDMYFDFAQLRDLTLRVGQYKVPHGRQRVVSSGDLKFVDRSIVNGEFNVDRDIGLDFRSKDFLGLDMFRYYLGIYAGEGRNTDTDADFGMMYLARVEFLPFGMFKDYKEGGFERNPTPKLSIGLAYGFIENAKRDRGIKGSKPADGGTTDTHHVSADVIFRVQGFSIESEFAFRSGERNLDGDDVEALASPKNGWGLMGQAGYLLPDTGLEISVRAGLNRRENNRSRMSDKNEYGAAISYYFANHPFKLQADYFRLSERKDHGKPYAFNQVLRVQLQASL